jgi:prepilin-type N-terminal cleavage/methylation domain-containing protein
MEHRSGFTLIELLVVIAILAVLAVVVVLTLNPTALLQQSRDNNRISDMASLNTAIGLYTADVISGGSLGQPNTVYVSIPDPTATTTAGDQCQGLGLPTLPATYTYQCAASSTYRLTTGTGWIPVNFGQTAFGSPVSKLPTDPVNTTSSRLYYTYTTDGTHYEVTSVMESQKYGLGGNSDVITPDGGTLASVYEKGSKLGLEPLDYGDSSLVDLWTFDEGTNNVAYDYSGSNATGSWSGSLIGGSHYTVGKVGTYAGNFDGSTDWVNVLSAPNMTQSYSYCFWVKPASIAAYGLIGNGGLDSLPLSGGAGNSNNVYLNSTGSVGYFIFNGSSEIINSAATLSAGSWYQICAVQNTATPIRQLFVNGVVSAQDTNVSTQSFSYLFLSPYKTETTFWPSVGYLNGVMDDVRIYNRALSATQIAAMYAGGK